MRTLLSIFSIIVIAIIASCKTNKPNTFAMLTCDLRDTGISGITNPPQLLIKKYDILKILLSDPTAKGSELAPCVMGQISDNLSTGTQVPTDKDKEILVDEEGEIQYNCIGKIKAEGKTIKALEEEMVLKLKKYLNNPMVVIRLANFKYTVEGEVNAPGVKSVENNRVTVLEAIAAAGGIKAFAQRDSVLLIRELINGKKETVNLNLKNTNITNSPYYYLQQNDYIYIRPSRKKQINEDRTVDRYVSLAGTIIGTISSIALLIFTLNASNR
jgi:polysaccharide biosynthesis/export protein